MTSLTKKILSTKLVWTLTGITYATAVVATHGSYIQKKDYINIGKNEMSLISKYFNKEKVVLEFGCGPGKNLFGISDNIKIGYGIDINSLYLRHARKLAEKYGFKNLQFLKYDSINFPINLPMFDVIFEKGVFERINKNLVSLYIGKLVSYLNSDGFIIIYFLMERAKGTKFTRKLGDSAYTYYNQNEISNMLSKHNLIIKEILNIEYADFYVCQLI